MHVSSMTGFARIEGSFEGGRFVWELRSVNGKSLELKLRLPAGFDPIEPELKRLALARLSRGNVQASLQIVRDAPVATFAINRALLGEIVAVTDELVRAGHAAPPSADGLLSLRGVIDGRDGDAPSIDAAILRTVVDGFEIALSGLVETRHEEGSGIGAVLLRRLDEVDSLVQSALADPSRQADAIVERLERQVRVLLGTGVALDPARLAQEAALLATRADIAEELDRLAVHLAAGRALLAAGGAIGRRLDFLSQEFNRESNTICSKSNSASLTAIGLELKVVIDQFREQVQNIE